MKYTFLLLFLIFFHGCTSIPQPKPSISRGESWDDIHRSIIARSTLKGQYSSEFVRCTDIEDGGLKLIVALPPKKPTGLFERYDETRITFEYDISVLGEPKNIKIIELSGSEKIIEAATNAINFSLYEPYVEDGKIKEVRGVRRTYSFLKEAPDGEFRSSIVNAYIPDLDQIKKKMTKFEVIQIFERQPDYMSDDESTLGWEYYVSAMDSHFMIKLVFDKYGKALGLGDDGLKVTVYNRH